MPCLAIAFGSNNVLCNEQGMLEDLRKAPEGSILLLHACAHNPTGAPGSACSPSTQYVHPATLGLL